MIFTEEEFNELEKIAEGDYTDGAGNVYTTPEDFDTDMWRESYRAGQEKGDSLKSTYSEGKPPIVAAYERKIEEIENDANLSDDKKAELIAIINQKIKDATP